MLGLFEEALIQYDEIDALLTQLVINSKFGGEYLTAKFAFSFVPPPGIAQ